MRAFAGRGEEEGEGGWGARVEAELRGGAVIALLVLSLPPSLSPLSLDVRCQF